MLADQWRPRPRLILPHYISSQRSVVDWFWACFRKCSLGVDASQINAAVIDVSAPGLNTLPVLETIPGMWFVGRAALQSAARIQKLVRLESLLEAFDKSLSITRVSQHIEVPSSVDSQISFGSAVALKATRRGMGERLDRPNREPRGDESARYDQLPCTCTLGSPPPEHPKRILVARVWVLRSASVKCRVILMPTTILENCRRTKRPSVSSSFRLHAPFFLRARGDATRRHRCSQEKRKSARGWKRPTQVRASNIDRASAIQTTQ